MPENDFNIAVLGAGCASLQFLHQLSQQPAWPQARVGLFREQSSAQRSWCFWAIERHPLQHLVKKSWQTLRFTGRGFSKTASIAPYQYHFIPGDDFFEYFNEDFLPRQKNIALIDAPVNALVPHEKGFTLQCRERQWQATQVYSSIFTKPATLGRFWLKQHFKGWFVRSDQAIFDDSCVTLMDFSIEQTQDTRFIYILPFSAQYALLEITVFSPETYADNAYDEVLKAYFQTHFPGVKYVIEKTEYGAIPMTDTLFPRRGAAGEVLLGAAAGMVKSSTGYAFKRIGEDVRQLAEDLQTGNKLRWAGTRGRFRFYDRLLLGILQQEPLSGQRIFETLFKRIEMKTILRFLDEDTNWREELRIFRQLPFVPFVKQIFHQWKP